MNPQQKLLVLLGPLAWGCATTDTKQGGSGGPQPVVPAAAFVIDIHPDPANPGACRIPPHQASIGDPLVDPPIMVSGEPGNSPSVQCAVGFHDEGGLTYRATAVALSSGVIVGFGASPIDRVQDGQGSITETDPKNLGAPATPAAGLAGTCTLNVMSVHEASESWDDSGGNVAATFDCPSFAESNAPTQICQASGTLRFEGCDTLPPKP